MKETQVLKNKLKEIRTARQLSQKELAEMLDVPRNTISSIETGQFAPTAKLALSISQALNVKIEDLFYLDNKTEANKSELNIEDFLKPNQKELFDMLRQTHPNACSEPDSFILVPGEAPVMLIAHLDTVHPLPVQTICRSADGNILMSPQGIGGDDRCGVYALCTLYQQSDKKPWLLFTCDEEAEGIGASSFCDFLADDKNDPLLQKLSEIKLLIEIDRRGKNDAVYYDLYNPEFEDYISSKGFRTAIGSFSDISFIAPVMETSAVNLSAGYYNEHQKHEFINMNHLHQTIDKVMEIIKDTCSPDFPRFEYTEPEYDFSSCTIDLTGFVKQFPF